MRSDLYVPNRNSKSLSPPLSFPLTEHFTLMSQLVMHSHVCVALCVSTASVTGLNVKSSRLNHIAAGNWCLGTDYVLFMDLG